MTVETNLDVVVIARQIHAASNKQLSELLYRLLRRRQLLDTVRGLNRLLGSSRYSSLVMASLRRLMLAQGG